MKTQMDAKGIRVDDLPSDKKETYKYFLSVYVQVMAYQQKKAAAANGAQGKLYCAYTCPDVSFIADPHQAKMLLLLLMLVLRIFSPKLPPKKVQRSEMGHGLKLNMSYTGINSSCTKKRRTINHLRQLICRACRSTPR